MILLLSLSISFGSAPLCFRYFCLYVGYRPDTRVIDWVGNSVWCRKRSSSVGGSSGIPSVSVDNEQSIYPKAKRIQQYVPQLIDATCRPVARMFPQPVLFVFFLKVMTKKNFVSQCHFDGGLQSEPFAIMNMLFEYEKLTSGTERNAFLSRNSLHSARVRRLTTTCKNLRKR